MNFYSGILEAKKTSTHNSDYFLKTKEEIKNWLDKYKLKGYKINNDLTVDIINKNSFIYNKKIKNIPFKFNKIIGDVDFYHTNINTLEFCPKEIIGHFNCSYNKLTSLEFCPEKITGTFDCSNNNLTSFEGMPKRIGEDFIFINNPFKTLKGLTFITFEILLSLIMFYPERLDWREIEWDKMDNLDEIIAYLWENIDENHYGENYTRKILERLEELQLV